jgi:Sulfotransferase family
MQAPPDPGLPHPADASDWRPGPPDFIGVGTARSGTTWWDSLVNAHPRVSRPAGTPKEVHFFDDRWASGLTDDDVRAYHALFTRPPGHLSGEWTPGYMLDAWTPALLHRAAPDARLLVMLRDPVERFRSGRTLAENRLTVGSTARAAANSAFNRGVYADQLLRLWSAVPREQVLVLQYERCVADPRAQLERTFEFIGLEPELEAGVDVVRRVNESRGPKAELSAWQEEELVRRYAPENARLATMLPELDLSLWKSPA